MPSSKSPWHRPAVSSRALSRWQIRLGALAVVGVLILGFTLIFPEIHLTRDDAFGLLFFAILLAVWSGNLAGRRIGLKETARNVVLWIGIVAALGLAYAYSDVLSGFGARLRGAVLPGEPVAAGDGVLTVAADAQGDFTLNGTVDGARVRFAVDTGASEIVLTPDDARRVGIDTATLHYSGSAETANGTGAYAPAHVDSLVIGPLRLNDVYVAVNAAPMQRSLLGMAFLRRLRSFAIADGRMTLRWK